MPWCPVPEEVIVCVLGYQTRGKLLSICMYLYFLPLSGGCLFALMRYILELVLRNLFSSAKRSVYRGKRLLIKAGDSDSEFLSCLPYELTIQYFGVFNALTAKRMRSPSESSMGSHGAL